MVSAFARLEVLAGFVPDFETFQFDDADELFTLFPHLTLSEFQRHTLLSNMIPPSGLCLIRGETVLTKRLLFLDGSLFAKRSRFLLLRLAVSLGLFLPGLLHSGFR